MSLINEALKKAQQQRTDENSANPLQASAAGFQNTRRNGTPTALLAVGAVVLVGISVAGTMYLVRKPTPPAAVASASATTPAKPADATTGSAAPVKAADLKPTPASPETKGTPPSTVAEKASPPDTPTKTSAAPAEAKANVATAGAATQLAPTPKAGANLTTPTAPATIPVAGVAASEKTAVQPATVAATPTPAAPAAPAPRRDERIHAFVDSMRVAGVKAAGADSRILMNDKVYRLNDFVDRTFQLRLVKVELDSLTFSDANGELYVKYF